MNYTYIVQLVVDSNNQNIKEIEKERRLKRKYGRPRILLGVLCSTSYGDISYIVLLIILLVYCFLFRNCNMLLQFGVSSLFFLVRLLTTSNCQLFTSRVLIIYVLDSVTTTNGMVTCIRRIVIAQ